ncbi:HDOD domain-containing protein [Shewanella submarina]|uniref:HDOD domain-containing protein n=1 Tax=Shewanella submarina TaxID=2016376 RepID=A0ABV7GB82_9GAMM|nr:HDOD domain-containing protein [Shewanella submarina]MCL1039392.1 HDOD domain-containing protein [Shewanella submarina]
MTELEQQVLTRIRAIMANEEQVIGRRGVLLPLKQAIISDGDIRVVIDIVAGDPALSAHLLWRSSCAHGSGSSSKNRSLKEALVRLGQVNIYRYAFTYYLKERLDELPEPYRKLVHGYWHLTEGIAHAAVDYLAELEDCKTDPDELHTLALFSVYGQIIALTAFAHLNADLDESYPLGVMKSLIDTQQQTLSVEAFTALNMDPELSREFLVAHNIESTDWEESPGMLLRAVLAKKGLLLNPLTA